MGASTHPTDLPYFAMIVHDCMRDMMKFLPQPRPRQRGFTIIAVMAILSVAVVMTYAMLRAEVMSVQLSRNTDRAAAARQAARTGLTMAIRQMHDTAAWGGVSSIYNRSLNATDSFKATYTAGDPNLTSADPDWEDYPYRVTIDVQGFAADPMVSNNVATANIRAVVKLVPVAMPAELTDWSTVLQHTIYQVVTDDFNIELPCRIEGSVRLQGALSIAEVSPNDEDARNQYLDDLNLAQLNSQPDYRPFDGPVNLPFSAQDPAMFSDLTVRMGVPAVDIPVSAIPSDWNTQPEPDDFSTYQIYPGGPVYTVAGMPGSMTGATFAPDPLTNPLGFFKFNGNLTLQDDTSIRGTMIVKDTLKLDGTNIVITPVDMLPLNGTTDPVRLPTVLTDELEVRDGATATVTGFVGTWNKFTVKSGTYNTSFDFKGHLVTPEFVVEPRDEWTASNWGFWHWLFQMSTPAPGPNQYFPFWLANPPMSFSPIPLITFKQDTQAAVYHWKDPDPNVTVYIPRAGDNGLYWDILRVEIEP